MEMQRARKRTRSTEISSRNFNIFRPTIFFSILYYIVCIILIKCSAVPLLCLVDLCHVYSWTYILLLLSSKTQYPSAWRLPELMCTVHHIICKWIFVMRPDSAIRILVRPPTPHPLPTAFKKNKQLFSILISECHDISKLHLLQGYISCLFFRN